MNIWVKWIGRFVLLCWCISALYLPEQIYASSEEIRLEEDESAVMTEETQEEILNDLELKEVEQLVKQLTGNQVSFTDMIKSMMSSGQALDWDKWKDVVSSMWQEAFGMQKETCIQILLLLLLTSFFSNIASAFKNPQIGEMAFYVCYLLLFLVVLRQINQFSVQIETSLNGICEFMKVLLPSYYLAIAASTGISTAAIFYQMIIGVIYLAQKLILMVLLPGIRFYLLIALVNHLTKDEWLSRMTNLIKNGISWILKTMLGLLLGMQVIQRLVSPAVDSLKQTILGKTAGSIPVLGDIFQGVTEIVLGSAVLIKNCLGVVAILCMLVIGLVPLLQLVIHGAGYQFLAAVMQPVTENRLISCVHTMGEAIFLLLRLLLTVEIMFLLTIAILAGTFG